jgi:hypothetical protein
MTGRAELVRVPLVTILDDRADCKRLGGVCNLLYSGFLGVNLKPCGACSS